LSKIIQAHDKKTSLLFDPKMILFIVKVIGQVISLDFHLFSSFYDEFSFKNNIPLFHYSMCGAKTSGPEKPS
jgi:hypothetical protein